MAPAQEEANHKREQDVLGVAILTSIADGSFIPYLLVLPVQCAPTVPWISILHLKF